MVVDGFVYFPDRFDGCPPFRLTAGFGEFRTSVGRGSEICRKERRTFLAYGIRFLDGESTRDSGRGGTATFLAVPRSADRERSPLDEYYVPRQRFQFVALGAELAFQTTCEETPVPVRRGSFVPLE